MYVLNLPIKIGNDVDFHINWWKELKCWIYNTIG